MVQKGGDRKGSLECKSVEGNGIYMLRMEIRGWMINTAKGNLRGILKYIHKEKLHLDTLLHD